MISHEVRVHPSQEDLPREEQLAWKIAAVAADRVAVSPEVTEMVINRVIDDAAVAIAAINRHAPVTARSMALAHPRRPGANVLGVGAGRTVSAEWAAWANGVAVRELDMHDTFLAAEYAHPGDTIPPLLAVGQALGRSGRDLIRGIATAYEIQIDLARSVSLHAHKIDHIAHLCPAQAAGVGTILGLPTPTIYQAIQQALHVSCTTRQSRKGAISSWKAFAPAHAGKLAIEAVDRAMRGEQSPSPIYEGEDSVIAALLDGPRATYRVALPGPREGKRAILESFTKQYSAEYQAQALIDLAFRVRARIADLGEVARIVIATSRHTHVVIGTGSNDPQKMDPNASRETLDHSAMYIFAVALEDGTWDHVTSYTRRRATRPSTVALWHKIETREDAEWTRRYHAADPRERAFGGRVEIFLRDGRVIADELAVADAHPQGAHPFVRSDYVEKFRTLTRGIISEREARRFLAAATELATIEAGGLGRLNLALPRGKLSVAACGIF